MSKIRAPGIDWDIRADALVDLTQVAKTVKKRKPYSPEENKALLQQIRSLAPSFAILIADLRSTLVKQVCHTIASLSETLGASFVAQVDLHVIPALLKRTCTSKAVIRNTAKETAVTIFKNGLPAISTSVAILLHNTIRDRKAALGMRQAAAHFVNMILADTSLSSASPILSALLEAIINGIEDPDESVRSQSRLNWVRLATIDENKAASLLSRISPNAVPHLKKAFEDEFGRPISSSKEAFLETTPPHTFEPAGTIPSDKTTRRTAPIRGTITQSSPVHPSIATVNKHDQNLQDGEIPVRTPIRSSALGQPVRKGSDTLIASSIPSKPEKSSPVPVHQSIASGGIVITLSINSPGSTFSNLTSESPAMPSTINYHRPALAHQGFPPDRSLDGPSLIRVCNGLQPVSTLTGPSTVRVFDKIQFAGLSNSPSLIHSTDSSRLMNVPYTSSMDNTIEGTQKERLDSADFSIDCSESGTRDVELPTLQGDLKLARPDKASIQHLSSKPKGSELPINNLGIEATYMGANTEKVAGRGEYDPNPKFVNISSTQCVTPYQSETSIFSERSEQFEEKGGSETHEEKFASPETNSSEQNSKRVLSKTGKLAFMIGTNVTQHNVILAPQTKPHLDTNSSDHFSSPESTRLSGDIGLSVALGDPVTHSHVARTAQVNRRIFAPISGTALVHALTSDQKLTSLNTKEVLPGEGLTSETCTNSTNMENSSIGNGSPKSSKEVLNPSTCGEKLPHSSNQDVINGDFSPDREKSPNNVDVMTDKRSKQKTTVQVPTLTVSHDNVQLSKASGQEKLPQSTSKKNTLVHQENKATSTSKGIRTDEALGEIVKENGVSVKRGHEVSHVAGTVKLSRQRRATVTKAPVLGKERLLSQNASAGNQGDLTKNAVARRPPRHSVMATAANRQNSLNISRDQRAPVRSTKNNIQPVIRPGSADNVRVTLSGRLSKAIAASTAQKIIDSTASKVPPSSGGLKKIDRGNEVSRLTSVLDKNTNGSRTTVSKNVASSNLKTVRLLAKVTPQTLSNRHSSAVQPSATDKLVGTSSLRGKTDGIANNPAEDNARDESGSPSHMSKKSLLESKDECTPVEQLQLAFKKLRSVTRLQRGDWSSRLDGVNRVKDSLQIVDHCDLNAALIEECLQVLGESINDCHHRVAVAALDSLFLLFLRVDSDAETNILQKPLERRVGVIRKVLHLSNDNKEDIHIACQRVLQSFEIQFSPEVQVSLLLRAMGVDNSRTGTGKSSLQTGYSNPSMISSDTRVLENGCHALVKAYERAKQCEGGFVWGPSMLEKILRGMALLAKDKHAEVRRGANDVINAVRSSLPDVAFDLACQKFGVKFARPGVPKTGEESARNKLESQL